MRSQQLMVGRRKKIGETSFSLKGRATQKLASCTLHPTNTHPFELPGSQNETHGLVLSWGQIAHEDSAIPVGRGGTPKISDLCHSHEAQTLFVRTNSFLAGASNSALPLLWLLGT